MDATTNSIMSSHFEPECITKISPNNFTVESVRRVRPEGEGVALVPNPEGEAPSSFGPDVGVVQNEE